MNNVVIPTKFLYFKGLVGPESIINQNSRPAIGAVFRLRIEHLPVPVKHNGSIGIALLGTSIVPPWRGMTAPITTLGSYRPDDEWRQGFPISGNTLDGGNQLAFNSYSSVLTRISCA
jgi:hypothetical protein